MCMRSACVRLRRRKWELRKLCGCWSERVTEEGSERQNCRPLEWQGQPWGKDIGRKSLEESKGESRQHWRGPNPCSLPLMKVISHIPMHDNDVCKCNDTRAHTHTCTFTHACPSCKIARGFLYLIQTNSGSLAAWFLRHMTNRATLCLFFHRLTFWKCLISQTDLSPASFGDVTERAISYTFFHCVNTTNIVLLAVTSLGEDLKLSLMPTLLWRKDRGKKRWKKSRMRQKI